MDENTNVQGTGTTAEQEKTFSQSEVDSLIQKRLERERKKYPSDDELTAFRSWRDSQRTQEERMEALTGERDTLSGRLTQVEAERDELRRELYVLKKGVTGEAAEFVAFKAAKLVSDKVSFEQAVDSILGEGEAGRPFGGQLTDAAARSADGSRSNLGFDWTARVGGGSTKTDTSSVMNALIRNARK